MLEKAIRNLCHFLSCDRAGLQNMVQAAPIFKGHLILRSNTSRLDIRFIFLITALCLTISSIPYLYGYLSTPADKMYTGLVGRDVPGSYMYFMWEVQSRDGHNFFENMLTSERHKRSYFSPEWWLLGRFLRYSGLPVIAGFHIERCLTVFLAVVILYYFISCFFETVFERRCVLLLVLFTTGLGWLFWIIGQWTGAPLHIKIWDIKGINLFGYLINKPHFIRSIVFICLTYTLLLKGEENEKTLYFFLAGLGVIIFGSIRPYNLPTAFILFALFPLLISVKEGRISRKRIKNYLVLIITSLPIVAYYVYLRYFTPLKDVWKGISLEPLTPLELVIWLGIPFVLALLGFDGFKDLKNKESPQIFLYLWGGVMAVLIYAYPLVPWGMESAGPCYIIAPILAGRTIFKQFVPAFSKRGSGKRMGGQKLVISMIIVILLVSLPSNLILMNNIIKRLSYHSRPYYLPDNVVNAFDWLRQNACHEDIVMSATGNGFYLPTFSSTKAFIGHGDFTIDFGAKNQLVSRFFDPKESHDFRKKLLNDYEVAYLFFSDVERGMGGFNPKEAPYLKGVYENPEVAIFEVALKNRHAT